MTTKKILITLAPIFLLSIATNSFGQQINPVGAWRVDLPGTLDLMEDSIRQKFEGLNEETRSRVTLSFQERKFVFTNNGTFRAMWKFRDVSKVSEGTWNIAGQRLTIEADNRGVAYDVSMSSSGGLILMGTDKGGIFNNLYLEPEQ